MNRSYVIKSFFILLLLYVFFVFNPIIINVNEDFLVNVSHTNNKKGDNLKPFNDFDFDSGEWKVCVIINERNDISSNIPYGRYLFTNNLKVIKKFKTLNFEYTGADVATVENEIVFYKNNKIVFRGYIVLDENKEGIQKETFGWIKGKKREMSLIIKDFELDLLPFIYL